MIVLIVMIWIRTVALHPIFTLGACFHNFGVRILPQMLWVRAITLLAIFTLGACFHHFGVRILQQMLWVRAITLLAIFTKWFGITRARSRTYNLLQNMLMFGVLAYGTSRTPLAITLSRKNGVTTRGAKLRSQSQHLTAVFTIFTIFTISRHLCAFWIGK
jgi:hypothetical protein